MHLTAQFISYSVVAKRNHMILRLVFIVYLLAGFSCDTSISQWIQVL